MELAGGGEGAVGCRRGDGWLDGVAAPAAPAHRRFLCRGVQGRAPPRQAHAPDERQSQAQPHKEAKHFPLAEHAGILSVLALPVRRGKRKSTRQPSQKTEELSWPG